MTNDLERFRRVAFSIFACLLISFTTGGSAVAQYTATSLATLRVYASTFDNATITLAPGDYWIDGDHIANPTNSEPIFLNLAGTNNTYNLTGANLKLDTRKLDGFGRALGHGSGVRVVKFSGDNNTINGLNLTGYDLEMDTDPNAQRHADWSAVYFQMTGEDNTVQGANVLTRGSTPYGMGDVFGKGARQDPQGAPADEGGLPWMGHRKTSAFQVTDTVDAVVNDMHLDVKTYGHGFFVQGTSSNTTLTNSTVTGELFSSNDVIATDLYQEYGFTSHGNELPADMMISGAEDGVRMYNGPTGLTVDNVVVTNMRTGFSTALGKGTTTLSNVEAYGTENAFNFRSDTTITNAKGDIAHGPLLHTPYDNAKNTSIEVELVGGVPEGVDWAVAYVAGDNLDVTIDSSLAAGALPAESMVRFGQVFSTNWRDSKNPTGPEDHGDKNYDYINSTFHNNTNQMLVLGNEATGNNGSSQAGVISNGKDNEYDGVSLVFNGTRLTAQHVNGLGNGGTADDGTLDSNASIVYAGATLEVQSGIRIEDEKLTISGDGVDGQGALYSDGSNNSNTRFGSSNGSDESTVFLNGDASIGVGTASNQMLVGQIQGTGDLTKRGAGMLVMSKSSTYTGNLIVAEGHVTARPGVVHTDLTVAAGASISGIGENSFNSTGDVYLDGTLDLNGRTDDNSLNGMIGGLHGTGLVTLSNLFPGAGGTLTIAGTSGESQFDGLVQYNVSIIKTGGGTQVFTGSNVYTGTTTVDGGTLLVDGSHTGGGEYVVNSGTLGGSGSIQPDITVAAGGTVSPGASASVLAVGDIVFESGSILQIDIGGTGGGTEYDQLLSGSTTLGGDLVVSLMDVGSDPFIPDSSTSFAAMLASSLTGAFENVASGERIATEGSEGSFVVSYSSTTDLLLLSDFHITGDFDSNGLVDSADFTVWRDTMGQTGVVPFSGADGTGDGQITQADYLAWQSNFGATATIVTAASVPEPGGCMMLLVLAGLYIVGRRR